MLEQLQNQLTNLNADLLAHKQMLANSLQESLVLRSQYILLNDKHERLSQTNKESLDKIEVIGKELESLKELSKPAEETIQEVQPEPEDTAIQDSLDSA